MVASGSATEPMTEWPQRLVLWLRRATARSLRGRVASAIVITVLVGLVDYATGPSLSLLLGYAICVVASGFFVARRVGGAVALLSATASAVVGVVHPDATIDPGVVLVNSSLRLVLFVALVEGSALLRTTVLHLDELAHVDEMTGLRNRRGFREIATHERLRAIRTRRPFAVAVFDLDGLKAVNDQRGHAEGDALICAFADALASGFRQSDCLARLGGDEFIALLPDTDIAGAERLVRRMAARCAPTTFGAGIAWSGQPTVDLDTMIAAADAALYRAKGRPDPVEPVDITPPMATDAESAANHPVDS